MTKKIRWGILSTAKIGVTKVIPAIQQSSFGEVVAISSRNAATAQQTAKELGIPKAYDSYEALLSDPSIDAIYNPLPNHMHVAWTLKALAAGKHVLCEKPIGLNREEATDLMKEASKFPQLKVMEAFMYRFHPQWIKTMQLISEGAIGEVKTIQAFFSYFNADPQNIRNKANIGGGGLMDIGCYCISFARYIMGANPTEAVALIDFDPEMKTDRLSSGMLKFSDGKSATFTCATQLAPFQRLHIFGTQGQITVEIPVNAPADAPCAIQLKTNEVDERIVFEAENQYSLQADAFAQSILDDRPVPTPLTDAVENMAVIDALFRSPLSKSWVKVD